MKVGGTYKAVKKVDGIPPGSIVRVVGLDEGKVLLRRLNDTVHKVELKVFDKRFEEQYK